MWHQRFKPSGRHAGSFIIFSGIKHLMFVSEQLVWKLLEISCRFHSESRSRTSRTPRPAAHPLIQHPHYFSVSQNENERETSGRRDKWIADCWSLIESIREMKRAGGTFAFLWCLSFDAVASSFPDDVSTSCKWPLHDLCWSYVISRNVCIILFRLRYFSKEKEAEIAQM